MGCSHVSSCELFPLFKLRQTLKIWQLNYCDSPKHTECARFQASAAGKSVPPTLLPNGKHLNIDPLPK